jgi:hypothetical protein
MRFLLCILMVLTCISNAYADYSYTLTAREITYTVAVTPKTLNLCAHGHNIKLKAIGNRTNTLDLHVRSKPNTTAWLFEGNLSLNYDDTELTVYLAPANDPVPEGATVTPLILAGEVFYRCQYEGGYLYKCFRRTEARVYDISQFSTNKNVPNILQEAVKSFKVVK